MLKHTVSAGGRVMPADRRTVLRSMLTLFLAAYDNTQRVVRQRPLQREGVGRVRLKPSRRLAAVLFQHVGGIECALGPDVIRMEHDDGHSDIGRLIVNRRRECGGRRRVYPGQFRTLRHLGLLKLEVAEAVLERHLGGPSHRLARRIFAKHIPRRVCI
jgi:hypothetical protein